MFGHAFCTCMYRYSCTSVFVTQINPCLVLLKGIQLVMSSHLGMNRVINLRKYEHIYVHIGFSLVVLFVYALRKPCNACV